MAGIYIHIPFCEKKCNYCDFYSITNVNSFSGYIDAVIKEIKLFINGTLHSVIPNNNYDLSSQTTLDSIFIGGGTPSLLESKDLARIFEVINRSFNIADNSEITIECNPHSSFKKKIVDYKHIGINRVSIGVQSLTKKELKFLERIHTPEIALKAITETLDSGISNVSTDIIFSIPGQTTKSLTNTLNQLFSTGITHLSAYSLIYEEGTPLFQSLNLKKIKPIKEAFDLKLYLLISEIAKSYNFFQYEISNYSQNGYQSKHNLNYWKSGNYIGFGPSAHSHINGLRYWNYSSLDTYYKKIKDGLLPINDFEVLTDSQKLLEEIFLSLRAEGFSFIKYNNAKLLTFIEHLTKNSLAYVESGILKLTSRGYFLCDEITSKIYNMLSSI